MSKGVTIIENLTLISVELIDLDIAFLDFQTSLNQAI